MNQEQTIFVVDDEPDVRAALSMLIRSMGMKPETYDSPQAYLEAYEPGRPGCLVLDVRMPGMSGLDLQQKLASMGPHPPIIMISGHGEIPNAAQAIQSGAIDFLQKPVSDQLLLDRIQQALKLDEQNRGHSGD
jgi:FixJ family two-component response regulator